MPLKGAEGFTGRVLFEMRICERFTFGVGAVPKPPARDVLGGFEPVVNYSVKPLAFVGGEQMVDGAHWAEHARLPSNV